MGADKWANFQGIGLEEQDPTISYGYHGKHIVKLLSAVT